MGNLKLVVCGPSLYSNPQTIRRLDAARAHCQPQLHTLPSFFSMSVLRFATRSLRPIPVRYFSTSTGGPTKSPSSNLPFYLGGAGLAGLASYVYLSRSGAPAWP